MKKTIYAFLICTLLWSLSGCGKNDPVNNNKKDSVSDSAGVSENGGSNNGETEQSGTDGQPDTEPLPESESSSVQGTSSIEPETETAPETTGDVPESSSIPEQTASSEIPSETETAVPSAPEETIKTETETDSRTSRLNISIGGKNFRIALYDNASSRALAEKMPMTLNMSELNGNEKFYNMSEGIETDSRRINKIQAGDFMLYGSDCLVLFYESFSTSYSYTPLGYVEDVTGLKEALGSGSAEVSFSAEQ